MTDQPSAGPAPAAEPPDRIDYGGLMECCKETLQELCDEAKSGRVGTEGQVLQCKHVDAPNHRMIFREGVWSWLRERILKLPCLRRQGKAHDLRGR